MPIDGPVDLVAHTEEVARDGRAGLGVQELEVLALKLVERDAVLFAQGELLLHRELLRAVVQQRRDARARHVRAVAPREHRRLVLRAEYMGHALGLEKAQRDRAQLLGREVLEVGVRTVEPAAQDVAVNGLGEKAPPPPLRELHAQLRRGYLHDVWIFQQRDARAVDLLKIRLLLREALRLVAARAVKGRDARKAQNSLRLVPLLQRQEHIRPHEQP